MSRPKGSKNSHPFPPAWYTARSKWIADNVTGKPKSDEQKAKMSLASKGKPKSDEHKAAMREGQIRRVEQVRAIQEELGCTYKEACKVRNETKSKD